MPSTLFRTASSTVVLLNNDSVLEVRRGDLRGSAIPDRRTWTSKDAWLAEIGEPVIEPAPVSEDLKLMASLARKYGAGMIKTHPNDAKIALAKTRENLGKVQAALTFLTSLGDDPFVKYTIPLNYQILKHNDSYYWMNKYSYITVFTFKQKKTLEEYAEHWIDILTASIYRLNSKAAAYTPKYLPHGKSRLFVESEDGTLRALYYSVGLNVCAVKHVKRGEPTEFRYGRTFEELGIKPVNWYARCGYEDDVMEKITDLTYRHHLF